MTREEAIELVCYGDWINILMLHLGDDDINRLAEAMCIIGNALRPITREQVERIRGKWEWKGPCGDNHGKFWETCSACGLRQRVGDYENFCPACGAPMTDKAVEITMKRMEEMRND